MYYFQVSLDSDTMTTNLNGHDTNFDPGIEYFSPTFEVYYVCDVIGVRVLVSAMGTWWSMMVWGHRLLGRMWAIAHKWPFSLNPMTTANVLSAQTLSSLLLTKW